MEKSTQQKSVEKTKSPVKEIAPEHNAVAPAKKIEAPATAKHSEQAHPKALAKAAIAAPPK